MGYKGVFIYTLVRHAVFFSGKGGFNPLSRFGKGFFWVSIIRCKAIKEDFIFKISSAVGKIIVVVSLILSAPVADFMYFSVFSE